MSSSGKTKNATPKIKNASVVVVRTEWNADIVDVLFSGCKKILEKEKIEFRDFLVPGAFEIPFAIKKCWEQSKNHSNDYGKAHAKQHRPERHGDSEKHCCELPGRLPARPPRQGS